MNHSLVAPGDKDKTRRTDLLTLLDDWRILFPWLPRSIRW